VATTARSGGGAAPAGGGARVRGPGGAAALGSGGPRASPWASAAATNGGVLEEFYSRRTVKGSHKSPDRVRNANSRNIIPVYQ